VGTAPEEIPRSWEAPNLQENKPRKKKTRWAAIATVLTVTGTLGGLTATGTFSSSADASSGVSVQAAVDLNKAISAFAGLGFGGKLASSVGAPYANDPTNCAESATGQVKKFLAHYSCEQYAADMWAITRQGFVTDVVFAWVEMPTAALASRYKAVVDTYNTGNPPGVSSAFNGRCYASGQEDATVWTVEIKPTGNVDADRMILQVAAQEDLSPAYLAKHCVA
jgi:hypothetical protein